MANKFIPANSFSESWREISSFRKVNISVLIITTTRRISIDSVAWYYRTHFQTTTYKARITSWVVMTYQYPNICYCSFCSLETFHRKDNVRWNWLQKYLYIHYLTSYPCSWGFGHQRCHSNQQPRSSMNVFFSSSAIQKKLNLSTCADSSTDTKADRKRLKGKKKKTLMKIMCHASCFICHMSHVTCCVSGVTCHLSSVSCQLSLTPTAKDLPPLLRGCSQIMSAAKGGGGCKMLTLATDDITEKMSKK